MEPNNDRPGRLDATGVIEQLTRVQTASQEEIERVKRVYHEIERRDGSANWHAALWFRFACLLAVSNSNFENQLVSTCDSSSRPRIMKSIK